MRIEKRESGRGEYSENFSFIIYFDGDECLQLEYLNDYSYQDDENPEPFRALNIKVLDSKKINYYYYYSGEVEIKNRNFIRLFNDIYKVCKDKGGSLHVRGISLEPLRFFNELNALF